MTNEPNTHHDNVTHDGSGEPGSSNPRETDHPTGTQQAEENVEEESPA